MDDKEKLSLKGLMNLGKRRPIWHLSVIVKDGVVVKVSEEKPKPSDEEKQNKKLGYSPS